MRTPWGMSERAVRCHRAPGQGAAYVVDTPRHGGILIDTRLAAAALSPEARALGESFGRYLAYEEDVAWALPAYEHPEWFGPAYGAPEGQHDDAALRTAAEATLHRWYNARYFHGAPSPNEQPQQEVSE